MGKSKKKKNIDIKIIRTTHFIVFVQLNHHFWVDRNVSIFIEFSIGYIVKIDQLHKISIYSFIFLIFPKSPIFWFFCNFEFLFKDQKVRNVRILPKRFVENLVIKIYKGKKLSAKKLITSYGKLDENWWFLMTQRIDDFIQ